MGAEKRGIEREMPLLSPGSGSGPGIGGGAIVAPGTSPTKGPERAERFDRFRAALGQLRPEDREIILLVSVKGIPVKEAARKLGKSPEATAMQLLRATRRLKEAFGKTDSTDSLRLPPDARLDGDGGGHGR